MSAGTPREALAEALANADSLGIGPDEMPSDMDYDWYADAILAALPAGWSLARTPSDLPDAPSLGDAEDGRELRLLREALPRLCTMTTAWNELWLARVWGPIERDPLASGEGKTLASAVRLCRERLEAGR